MAITRREFLQVLAAAGTAGFSLNGRGAESINPYDFPPFGNVSLLHLTDCHAQLLPGNFREPNINLGLGSHRGQPPHIVGEALLKRFGIAPGSRAAHAFTHLDFVHAARQYGKVGGFSHLATLVKQLRAARPGALLLDGGDSWQGSATALWTNGQDMVDASKLLGVDIMTGHWEFTLGADRVKEIVDNDFRGKINFLAQNVSTHDFGDAVFPSHTVREINGVRVAVIGQAFPYTPIANPAYKVPNWSFGIQEESLQRHVDNLRAEGIPVVVLLSHNGMDVDLKLASRIRSIDVILGGHTHDATPEPVIVDNPGGKTLVTNAGSNGKFLGVMDLDVKAGKVSDFRYRLLPIFADLIPADPAMDALIRRHRQPFETALSKELATTETLLYRRGNFNGSFDQLILNAMLKVMGAEIAFSAGFRWGTALLPGSPITHEDLMAQTAITYPYTEVNEMSGSEIKATLEDKADNLFNPDPYLQQGGDMTRVGGLQYSLEPSAPMGKRISRMTLNGKALGDHKRYKVASWASLNENASGPPIWNVVGCYLRDQRTITPSTLNLPHLVGVNGNPGMDA
jgi:S-sulfosulfanyl-L-cysteine sulfohydrolase